ncbi:hypothetical protein FRX31_015390 [Thalictrum thalictroides]|uniref:Uncharacterized protein n=1 Tax=Thalictrum thalictroides TaxID=46969 RepID=A0A7J6WEI1_THATH|nr:hypothetical protein FRX31_015390 [Thalictrum thalictroides]
MDLETESRIASILMKEAAEVRRQAEKEGINVYLQSRMDKRSYDDSPRSTSLGNREHNDFLRRRSTRDREQNSHFASSSKTKDDTYSSEDGCLKDEETKRLYDSYTQGCDVLFSVLFCFLINV